MSDLICERLGEAVLRLKWECWEEYQIEIVPESFRVADRIGREVTQRNIGNFIWWKPLAHVPVECGERWYGFHECKCATSALVGWARRECPKNLAIDPQHDATIDKFHQLRTASKYFAVPVWCFTTRSNGRDWAGTVSITKSVGGRPIPGSGTPAKVLYTTAVGPAALSDGCSWLIQRRVDASLNLTIMFAGGEQFCFALDRSLFAGLDWRQAIGDPVHRTGRSEVPLPTHLMRRVAALMRTLGLGFERLDLLVADRYFRGATFLEVNPNDHWAWPDLEQSNGLFDSVMRFLTR